MLKQGPRRCKWSKRVSTRLYVSGWQVAGDMNTVQQTYPDQSLYPVDSVPTLVRRINNALQRADQIAHNAKISDQMPYWYAPILADAEAGFGGVLNTLAERNNGNYRIRPACWSPDRFAPSIRSLCTRKNSFPRPTLNPAKKPWTASGRSAWTITRGSIRKSRPCFKIKPWPLVRRHDQYSDSTGIGNSHSARSDPCLYNIRQPRLAWRRTDRWR